MAPGYCPDCFTGTLRGDVEPTGTIETVHGLPTYVARPAAEQTPLGVVVIIPDAYGWELPNTRALADAYARRGPFIVYLPDFMDGTALPVDNLVLADKIMKPSPDWLTTLVLKPWWFMRAAVDLVPFLRGSREAAAKPRIQAFFQALRASTPLKVGVAGFCWGGRYTVLLCGNAFDAGGDAKSLVDCGFTAHPSLLAIPEEIEPVQQPLSLANGEDDMWMGRAKTQIMKRILESKQAGHEVVIYDGAVHGFAVRGDPLDPRQADLGLRAEDQAVAWYRKQFEA